MKAKTNNNTLKKNRKSFPFLGEKCVLNGTNYLHKIQYTVYPTYQFPWYGGKGGSGKERCFLNLGGFFLHDVSKRLKI